MSDNNIFLTVGIPTFNRPRSLHGLLVQISRMDNPIRPCEILIINNGDGYEIDLELICNLSDKYDVTIITNKANCGGQENVLRIYENASGEYVWFIGDDDRLSENSINEVLQVLDDAKVDVLHFNSDAIDHPKINKNNGEIEFIELLSGQFPLRKLMFAPLFVVRRSTIIGSMARVRLWLGCFAPQLSLMLLSEPTSVYFLNKIIVKCEEVPVTRNQRLSILPVFLGLSNISKVSNNPKLSRAIKKLLKKEWGFYLSPKKIVGALAIERISGRNFNPIRYMQASFKTYPAWLSIGMLFSIVCVRIVPATLLYRIIGAYYKKVRGFELDFFDFYSEDRI